MRSKNVNTLYRSLLLIGFTLLGAACSTVKPYTIRSPLNANMRAQTSSGTILRNTRYSIDIFVVNPGCQLDYKGSVTLEETPIKVGLPTNQLSYLQFRFEKAGLFESKGTLRPGGAFKPRHLHNYEITMSYRKSIYNFVVYEISNTTNAKKEVELINMRDCGKFRF